jgi:hypothetical protein
MTLELFESIEACDSPTAAQYRQLSLEATTASSSRAREVSTVLALLAISTAIEEASE